MIQMYHGWSDNELSHQCYLAETALMSTWSIEKPSKPFDLTIPAWEAQTQSVFPP